MVLGVPGARDRGCEGRSWEEKDETVLVHALEKRRGSPPTGPRRQRCCGRLGPRGCVAGAGEV
jgi:hypothetical protein